MGGAVGANIGAREAGVGGVGAQPKVKLAVTLLTGVACIGTIFTQVTVGTEVGGIVGG